MTEPRRWQPREIRRFVKNLDTATETVIVETDVGPGYMKAMGNRGGEHALACEWVGTNLARWFGLATLDFGLIEVTGQDEIRLYRSGLARPGPAFITRKERGQRWSGTVRQLRQLVNPEDITRLIIFDTWTRNWDRRSPDGERVNHDNVFLGEEAPKGQLLLKAIDHGHCFTWGRHLSAKLVRIEYVKDAGVYGLFPAFRKFCDRRVCRQAVRQLGRVARPEVEEMASTIPPEWDVSRSARDALVEFIIARARFLVDTMEKRLLPQLELFLEEAEE